MTVYLWAKATDEQGTVFVIDAATVEAFGEWITGILPLIDKRTARLEVYRWTSIEPNYAS